MLRASTFRGGWKLQFILMTLTTVIFHACVSVTAIVPLEIKKSFGGQFRQLILDVFSPVEIGVELSNVCSFSIEMQCQFNYRFINIK